MKLIINSAPLIPPLSGIGRYTQYLTQCLLAHAEIEDIRAFSSVNSYSSKELIAILNNLQSAPTRQKSTMGNNSLLKTLVKKIPLARLFNQQLRQKLLQKTLTHLNSHDYLYWETNYILQNYEGHKITTVYDLSYVRHPEFHPQDRQNWLQNTMPKSLEKADAIVTISAFSKQEIIDEYAIAAEKIVIVPPAVAHEFRSTPTQNHLLHVKKSYQLPSEFILSVGNIEPRKNILGLIHAYEQLPISLKKHFPLVIVGHKAWLSHEIEKKIIKMEKTGHLIWLGYVCANDLPCIYRLATLFMYISFYEGFGMPIAEAMSCGTPVITSNRASMPEVSAGCTELINPYDIQQITDKIQELIETPLLRFDLAQRAATKSKDYTWDKSALKLMALFNSF